MPFLNSLKKLFHCEKVEQVYLFEQNTPTRYLDISRLDGLLTELFGQGNYRIRMREDQWILDVPRTVTDEELLRAKPI